MASSNGFVKLLTSQVTVDLDSGEPFFFSSQCSGASGVSERRKWSPKEDLILIGAWLNTRKDPIVSNEQKRDAFWVRIVEYYNANPQLVGTIPRTEGPCKQRWSRINEGVCKFAGCYDLALREQRSGQNENDVMARALDIYSNDEGKVFGFEHAWRELRNDVKWCSTYLEKDKRKAVDDQGSEPEAEAEERPMGVKAAKAGKRKKTGKEEELSKLAGLMDIKKKISNQSILDRLLAKAEPLSHMEAALRDKLISEMLS
ncbi:hypothetical protein Bca4012_084674 [Brassica carinata]